MNRISLFFILFYFAQISYAINISFYSLENKTVVEHIDSPEVKIPGTPIPFLIENATLFVPTDNMHACDSNSLFGSLGKMVIVDSEFCAYENKIRNVHSAGAIGMIIISTENTISGFDCQWAGQNISPSEKINLPTVEIIQNDANFILSIRNSSFNMLLSINDGDKNEWKDVFNSLAFIIGFQVSLGILEALMVIFPIYLLIEMTRYGLKKGKSISQILILSIPPYVLYITIFGSTFALIYVTIDPFHSRGIFSKMTDTIFTTFSYPSCFIGSFLLNYVTNNVSDMSKRKKILGKVSINIKRIVIVLVLFAIVVLILDLTSSIIRGGYNDNFLYVEIAGGFYAILPLIIIAFSIWVSVKFHRLSRDSGDSSSGTSTLYRMSKRLTKVAIFLTICYSIWFIFILAAFIDNSFNYPKSRVSIFFFYFLSSGMAHLANILFIPREKTEKSTSSFEESANYTHNSPEKSKDIEEINLSDISVIDSINDTISPINSEDKTITIIKNDIPKEDEIPKENENDTNISNEVS